jgi:hypothetical protein
MIGDWFESLKVLKDNVLLEIAIELLEVVLDMVLVRSTKVPI